MTWLPWAPLAAVILHICEEFVYPGGFAEWYRRYRANASRVTSRFLVIINAVLLLACVDIGILGRTTTGVGYWLTIMALLCSNGIWHLWASYKSHSYSPGVVTGVLIYVPLALYGYVYFLRSGATSIGSALVAVIVGGSYQFWSALYHRSLRVLSQKRAR
jgi:Protein of unknown function with HXXEE motif